jgi:hypothetical protein
MFAGMPGGDRIESALQEWGFRFWSAFYGGVSLVWHTSVAALGTPMAFIVIVPSMASYHDRIEP